MVKKRKPRNKLKKGQNFQNSDPNKFEKAKKRFLNKWYIVVIVFFLILMESTLNGIKNVTLIYNWVKEEVSVILSQSFDESSKTFNIIILPFDRKEKELGKELKFEETLLSRFMEMKERDSINIQAIYLPNVYPNNYNEAREECKKRNGNLVLYGDYYESSSVADLKYVLVDRESDDYAFGSSGLQHIASLADLKQGKLQKNIDIIILYSISLQYFYKEKNYYKAINYLEKIPKKHEKVFFNIFNLLGVCYLEIGNYETALSNINKSIELDSSISEAYSNCGVVYRRLGNYRKAIEYYNKAISLDSSNNLAYFNRGLCFMDMRVLDSARTDFEKAIQMDEFHFQAWLKLGEAYLNLKQYQEAITCFRKVLKQNSNLLLLSSAYSGLGSVYNELQMDTLSILNLTYAITFNPNFDTLYFNRGAGYMNIKNYDLAIKDFTKAISIDNNFLMAYIYRSNAYALVNDYQLAILDLNKSIEIDSLFSIHIYFNRASCYFEIKEYQKAIEDFTFYLQHLPNDKEVLNSRGYLYLLTGYYEKAIKDLSKAIHLDHNYAYAYSNRGFAYANIGKFELAFKDFQKSKVLDSTNSVLYKHWGLTLLKLKKYNESLKELEKATTLNSELKMELKPYIDTVQSMLNN